MVAAQEGNETLDLVAAIKGLYAQSPQELNKLIEDAEDDVIRWVAGDGSTVQINLEFLARSLALHLMEEILKSKDEETFKYLLRGFRLLLALYTLTPSNSKLEEVLHKDSAVSDQILDLVFYVMIVLCAFRQVFHASSNLVLLHSALVACNLHLLKACFPVEWHELATILVTHPKVDVFMGVAFAAIRINIQFIQVRLSTGMGLNFAEVHSLCKHCETSLLFLQSLYQQEMFREHLLKNKEPYGVGGVMLLVQDILKLPIREGAFITREVLRLRSKVLSILLHLCEAESLSRVDVAANTDRGLDLTKSIIFKADVLTTIFSLPHGEFLSRWCSPGPQPSQEDATLNFETLAEARWVLDVLLSSNVPEPAYSFRRCPLISYARERTSLLVKAVANLTCFLPDLSNEERELFFDKFLECLQKELPESPDGVSHGDGAERAAIINQNLGSLLNHAKSLIPNIVTEDNFRVLRMFFNEVEPLLTPQEPDTNQVEEAHSGGRGSPPAPDSEHLALAILEGSGNQNQGLAENPDAEMNPTTDVAQTVASRGVQEGERGALNGEPSVLDSSSIQLRNSMNSLDITESSEHTREVGLGEVPEDERVENVQSEEQQTKRRHNIMNRVQISMIEEALQDGPDMHRDPALIRSWADRLTLHGPEVAPSQLKNSINNRLASQADKPVRLMEGQHVMVIDETSMEIGTGCIHMTHGTWFDEDLVAGGLCIVDIIHLKVDKTTKLPHPRGPTGDKFETAKMILGRTRVVWESRKLIPIQ